MAGNKKYSTASNPTRAIVVKTKDPRSARVDYVAPTAPPKKTKAGGSPEGLIKDLKKIDEKKKKSVGLLYRIFG